MDFLGYTLAYLILIPLIVMGVVIVGGGLLMALVGFIAIPFHWLGAICEWTGVRFKITKITWLSKLFPDTKLRCAGGCGTAMRGRTYCDPCAAIADAKYAAKRARAKKRSQLAHAKWMAQQRRLRAKAAPRQLTAKTTPSKTGPVVVPAGQPYTP